MKHSLSMIEAFQGDRPSLLVEKKEYGIMVYLTNLVQEGNDVKDKLVLEEAGDYFLLHVPTIEVVLEGENYKYKALEKTATLRCIKVTDENLKKSVSLIDDNIKLVDPSKPVYAIYYITTPDDDYAPRAINFNPEHTTVSDMVLALKRKASIAEMNKEGLPSSFVSESSSKIFELFLNIGSIDTQVFKFVVDKDDMDSVVAISVFTAGLGGRNIPVCDYRDIEKDNESILISFTDKLEANDKTLVFKADDEHTLSYYILMFVNKISKEVFKNETPAPSTVEYLIKIVDRIKNTDSLYDSQLQGLISLIKYSGAKDSIKVIHKFISNMTAEMDESVLAVFYKEALGEHLSQAVKKIDTMLYNIETAKVVSITVITDDFKSDNFVVASYKANDYVSETIDDLMGGFVKNEFFKHSTLIVKSVNTDVITYRIVSKGLEPNETKAVIQTIKENILKNIGSSVVDSIYGDELTILDREDGAVEAYLRIYIDDIFNIVSK